MHFSYLPGISIEKSDFDYAWGLLAVVCQKTGSLFKIVRETVQAWASRDGLEARREILQDRSSPRARRHYFCWPLHLNAILSAWAKYVIYGSRVSQTTKGFTAHWAPRVTLAGVPLEVYFSLSLSCAELSSFLTKSSTASKPVCALNEVEENEKHLNANEMEIIFVQKFDFKNLNMR